MTSKGQQTVTRLQQILERDGLLVPPEEKHYSTGRVVDREKVIHKLSKLRLDPPLSADIIADRDSIVTNIPPTGERSEHARDAR